LGQKNREQTKLETTQTQSRQPWVKILSGVNILWWTPCFEV
jgi:hypothetical protein